jgi:integrase
MWTLMSSVFKLAIRDGLLVTNPCAGGEMLYSGSRIDVIWSSTQVGAFLAQRKYAFMHLPLLIGLWTGQREGDVLRMKWADYDGQTIKVKQRKGRRRRKQGSASIVVIPVAGPLKAVLDAELAARGAAKVSPLKIEMRTICLTSEGESVAGGQVRLYRVHPRMVRSPEAGQGRGRQIRRSARYRGHSPRPRRLHGSRDLRHYRTHP